MPTDAAEAGMRDLVARLHKMTSHVLVAEPGPGSPQRLPALPAEQPDADAVCLIQSFYSMTVGLAARLGIDVDRPRNLTKVTRTT
jgi:glucosamine--fructose-6-phosphate aminotransferase (isomerizing)